MFTCGRAPLRWVSNGARLPTRLDPAVGGGPTTAGGPLRVECPRGVAATAAVGRVADGGSPTRLAGCVRMPAGGGAAATAGALREVGYPAAGRFQVGGLPAAGRSCWWCGHLRPGARTRRRAAGSGSASRVGLRAATAWKGRGSSAHLRCSLPADSGWTAGAAGLLPGVGSAHAVSATAQVGGRPGRSR